jgi:hypothetical protein
MTLPTGAEVGPAVGCSEGDILGVGVVGTGTALGSSVLGSADGDTVDGLVVGDVVGVTEGALPARVEMTPARSTPRIRL